MSTPRPSVPVRKVGRCALLCEAAKATSLLELIEAVLEIDRGFAKHMTDKKLSARKMPKKGEGTYIKVFWAWILRNQPGLFKNWQQFAEMKSFVHGMTKAGLLKRYQEALADSCNFASSRLNNGVLISANKKLFTTIYDVFLDTIPSVHLDFILMAALRMAYPSMGPTEEVGGQDVPEDGDDFVDPKWIFDSSESISMVALLKCPMAGSTTYIAAKKKSTLKEQRPGRGVRAKATAKTAMGK